MGGAEVKLHSFLTSKQVAGMYKASCQGYIMSGERVPGTHLGGIQSQFGHFGNNRISCHCWKFKQNSLIIQTVTWSL